MGKTGQAKKENEIRKRNWKWLGHTFRKPQGNQTGFVLEPAGYKKKRKTREYMKKRLGKG
jgi:hypothetical protein